MQLTKISPQQRRQFSGLTLQKKIELAEKIILDSFKEFSPKAIAWTGGKDSTVLLWLIRKVCSQHNLKLPQVVVIDEGDMFPEMRDFIEKVKIAWKFQINHIQNSDVLSQVCHVGDIVSVNTLNSRNRKELKKLNYHEPTFPFNPESLIGNHLMKTVTTNVWLEKNKVRILFTGVRWDEQEVRSQDNFYRTIDKPKHARVEPILHFTEKDVWKTIHVHKLPYVSLYERGYRSLGARSSTQKMSDKPAWKQDSKTIAERAGRQQDKEKIMQRLRDLGYM